MFFSRTPGYRRDRGLDLERSLLSLPLLLLGVDGLLAHDATAPLAGRLLVLLEVAVLDGGDELGELVLVLGADLGQGEDSGGLVRTLASSNGQTGPRA